MDFKNIKIIKKLGSGVFGTTYLVTKDNKKYAMKIQHILPKHRTKSFQYELWRELDLYEYINTLNKNDSKFFTKLYAFEIYDNCKHKQKRPYKLGNDPWAKGVKQLNKSDWCVKFLMDYKGKQTFGKYMSTHSIKPKEMRSFILQIIKITLLLQKGGYCHCDLHAENIMVNKTKEKYFMFQGHKIPFYGNQLIAIDYGLVLHKKFKITKKDKMNYDRYKWFAKDINDYIFIDLINASIKGPVMNFDKKKYKMKKNKKKMPWEVKKDPDSNLIRKIIINHRDFWNESKEDYLKLFPKYKKNLEIILTKIETSKGNIAKIIEQCEINKINTTNIWEIIGKIANKFELLHPKLEAKYYGWATYVKPNLPKQNILDILKITNMKNLIKYILNMKV